MTQQSTLSFCRTFKAYVAIFPFLPVLESRQIRHNGGMDIKRKFLIDLIKVYRFLNLIDLISADYTHASSEFRQITNTQNGTNRVTTNEQPVKKLASDTVHLDTQ